MTEFTPNEIDLEQINGGKKYKNGDGLQPETINALVEGVAFVGSGGSANFEYAGTCIFGLDYFSTEDWQWREKITKSSEKFLDKNGKYLVQCSVYCYDYMGQAQIVQGTTATVIDCSTTVDFEVLLPSTTDYRNEGGSLEYGTSNLWFVVDVTDDYDGISCNYIYSLSDQAQFECTLTFIKIG